MRLERARKIGRKFQSPIPTQVGGPSLAFRALYEMATSRKERTPKVPLGPFRTDVTTFSKAPESGLRVTWFGHSSLLLEIDGARVLVDPIWDERASPSQRFGPRRFFAPTMRLDEVPPLDAVLLSHDHYDHLGEGTLRELARLQPAARWVTSLGVGPILQRFGVAAERIIELDWTQSVDLGGKLTITALPARHFSGRSLFNRFQTLWSSFVLKGERHSVYYGADSGLFPGFRTIGKEYGPFDLVMLEVGAFNEMWKDIHMGPDGAVEAFEAIGSGVLMPIHWGLFDLALHAWREPIERVWDLAAEREIRLFSPEPGVPTEFAGAEFWSEWWRYR